MGEERTIDVTSISELVQFILTLTRIVVAAFKLISRQFHSGTLIGYNVKDKKNHARTSIEE